MTDFFMRQKDIEGWNQENVENQVALCLGVGGLGCTVTMDCVRLGFKKIFMVDFDTVDYHNLNRQVLFSKDDVGRQKVDAAKESLENHNIRTEIIAEHFDATENWDKIVEMAKQSTVIFNMIDVGGYFDFAVQSLALELNIAMILGGTYQQTITIDFAGAQGKPCWSCFSDLENKEIENQLTRDKILQLNDISFIPSDSKPTGISNVCVATTCAHFMVNSYLQSIMGNPIPNRLIFYYNMFDIDKWEIEANKDCKLCGKM